MKLKRKTTHFIAFFLAFITILNQISPLITPVSASPSEGFVLWTNDMARDQPGSYPGSNPADPSQSMTGIHEEYIYSDGRSSDVYHSYHQKRLVSKSGDPIFCVEPGVDLYTKHNYKAVEVTGKKYTDASLVAYWGFDQYKGKSNWMEYAAYTELMIQSIMDTGVKSQKISDPTGQDRVSQQRYDAFRLDTQKKIDAFYSKPSFADQIHTLKMGEEVTLTDLNGFLQFYELKTNTGNVDVKQNGNDLVITTKVESKETGVLGFEYKIDPSFRGATLLIDHSNSQDLIRGRIDDPAAFTLNIGVEKFGEIEITKTDSEGGALLANAEFHVLDSTGKEVARGKTDASGKVVFSKLPQGKYTVKEIGAPDGYLLNTKAQTIDLKANTTGQLIFENQRVKGNATIIKKDSETNDNAQGKATLEGAVFGLFKEDGSKIDEVSLKNVDGQSQATIENLELGKYYWQELEAPNGYNLNSEKYPFELRYEGQTVPLVTSSNNVNNAVIKGSIDGHKLGNKPLFGGKKEVKPPLKDIELTATSKSTGKAYKTVTDELGYFEINNLPYDDYILTETKGKTGYKLIDPIEFSIVEEGQSIHYLLEDNIIEQRLKVVKYDNETGEVIPLSNTLFKIFDKEANDGEGAYVSMRKPNSTEYTDIFATNDEGYFVTSDTLKYGVDRYELHEFRSPQNYTLGEKIPFSVTNDEDEIQTIYFGNDPAIKDVELFKYEEFNGKKTPLRGVTFTLYDSKGTEMGQYVTDENGKLTVKGLKAGEYYFKENEPLESFYPNEDLHHFGIEFGENGAGDGELLLTDVENELMPPTLSTNAVNNDDKLSVVDPLEKITIIDTVTYNNLFAGKEYTVKGLLMDKDTNEPLLVNGKEIRSELVFTPTKGNGTVELEFILNASDLHGKETVVFEDLYRDSVKVGSHADIKDKQQTIRFTNPEVGTKAVYEDGLSVADPLGKIKMTDTVSLKDLIPGKEYKLEAVIMDKETGEPLLLLPIENEHVVVRNTIEFTADSEDMEVEVPFEFNITDLRGKDLVVFEKLYRLNPDGEYEEVASHEDMEDEGQTVRVTNPEIATKATVNGKKEAVAEGKITIKDEITFKDLIVGQTYLISGILMDKVTGKPLLVNGKEVVSELIFVAETESGSIQLDFVIDDASILEGKEIVVFEKLYGSNENEEYEEITSHEDIEDEAQTVKFVKKQERLPQTGDGNSELYMIGTASLTIGGAALFMVYKKKRNQETHSN